MSKQLPQKKVGRGGAGNFYSKMEDEFTSKGKAAADLEAQPFPTDSLSRAISSSLPPPEYLHTGRGGAGNWVKPAELDIKSSTLSSPISPVLPASESSSPTTPSTSPNPTIAISKRAIGASKSVYRGGRGGAGNFVNPVEEDRLKREEEDRLRAEMEGRILRDVEAGLARPERAYGGRGGAWEMGSMS